MVELKFIGNLIVEASKRTQMLEKQRRKAKIRFWIVSIIIAVLLFIALCLVTIGTLETAKIYN